MSGKQRRRRGEHEEESLERWLITYADMIALLMAFFIMMYAMSAVDLRKFEALAGSMGTAFGGAAGTGAFGGQGPPTGTGVLEGSSGLLFGAGAPTGSVPGSVTGSASLANKIIEQVKRSLPEELGKAVDVVQDGERVTVRLKQTHLLFPAGQAALSARARRILREIGAVLYEVPYQLRTEGHTCDLPIRTHEFPSNWELSAARAANVMAYLIRQARISPLRVHAVGFGDTRPLVPNDSEPHRRRNRRVDIVVLSDQEPGQLAELARRTTSAELRPAPPPPPERVPQPESVQSTPVDIVPRIQLCSPCNLLGTHFAQPTAELQSMAAGG